MRQLVYDLPTRLFHWLFAGLFLVAFIIAKTIDDDSPSYAYHMLAGLSLGFLVFLRLIWGFAGTQHARFSEFVLNPKELISYFIGFFSGDKKRWAGHNPASSWAAVIMFILAISLGVTGYLMTSGGNKEAVEDVHEVLANSFLIVVIFHVTGVILHTIRHKEFIALSMIDGKKAAEKEQANTVTQKTGYAIGLIVLMLFFGFNLFKNYDSQLGKLNFFGVTLSLGENESENESVEDGKVDGEDKNEDDEDED